MKKNSECNLQEIVKMVEEQNKNSVLDLEEIRSHLNDQMSIRVVPKDGTIAKKENEGKYVYYVMSGTYFHYRISKHGRMNFLSNEIAPQWIDIGKVIASEYANNTEDKVLTECTVLDIKAEYFIRCINEKGEFSYGIIENLLKKMSKISLRADRKLLSDAKEGVMFYYLEYWNRNEKISGICKIQEKNDDIADAIGISVRTLYRIQKELRAKEIITIKKGRTFLNSNQIQIIREFFSGLESHI